MVPLPKDVEDFLKLFRTMVDGFRADIRKRAQKIYFPFVYVSYKLVLISSCNIFQYLDYVTFNKVILFPYLDGMSILKLVTK